MISTCIFHSCVKTQCHIFLLACGAFGVCKLQLFWLLVIVLAFFWLMVIVLALAFVLGDSGSCNLFWLLALALGSWLLALAFVLGDSGFWLSILVILALGSRSSPLMSLINVIQSSGLLLAKDLGD
jgi:hypothetical protein